MKLFVIYIGGTHEKAFIEVHDMRFVVADKIEDTYDVLKKTWWGTKESLHLDAWGALEYADGYNISLKDEPSTDTENKLYFVNLGGYDSSMFTEKHKDVFVVAPTASKAKVRALKQILHWESYHRDYQYEVDEVIDLTNFATENGKYIHLGPTDTTKEFTFKCKYTPIGRQ
jgi:hypothetical protein